MTQSEQHKLAEAVNLLSEYTTAKANFANLTQEEVLYWLGVIENRFMDEGDVECQKCQQLKTRWSTEIDEHEICNMCQVSTSQIV